MSEIAIEDFLNNEYSQTALYASFRSIASYVDGMKPSSRKIVYTLKKKNITTEVKVSRLASTVSELTEYLHGEGSLQGVISGMAQTFVGANNEALLYPAGSFGTRFVPTPSAPRYIFTKKSSAFDSYFSKDDDDVLIKQEFEGEIIEPKFFVPIFPLLLINGSEGIGTGFAQKILPRNKQDLIKYIENSLSGKTNSKPLTPYYEGFRGKIIAGEGEGVGSWSIIGSFKIKDTTTIIVDEVPVGYTLSSYSKVLDSLEERKIIRDYTDKSENDNFLFEIKVSREFTKQSEEEILNSLKLIKRVSENYTCIDENNSIREFESAEEILEAYIKIRLEYYKKRKQYLLKNYSEQLSEICSKALFISEVIDDKIHVNNVPKHQIITSLTEYEDIIQINGSYDYLLNMPIYSLTKEKYEELLKKAEDKKQQIKTLKSKSETDLWFEEIK